MSQTPKKKYMHAYIGITIPLVKRKVPKDFRDGAGKRTASSD